MNKKNGRGAVARPIPGNNLSTNADASKTVQPDPRLTEAISLLPRIPADDYAVWFETGCALKKLGAPYEAFRDWSATSQKFDAGACEQKWEALPDDPRCSISTIRRYAGVEVGEYHPPFVEPPADMMSAPTSDDERVRQAAEFVCTLFRRGEFFELCGAMSLKGRVIPDREDDVTQLDEETTVDDLCQAPDFRESILTPDTGLYVGLNPVQDLEGTGHKAPTDAMVTDYRLALLECDEMSVEEQWAAIRTARLPIAAITFSGSKSLHVLVRVDAGTDLNLYKERVAKLHECANSHGFKADPSCRNPSRLTRLPGAKRGENTQRMVSWAWGYPDWNAFAAVELTPTSASVHAENNARPALPEDEPPLVIYGEQGAIKGLHQRNFARYAMRELGLLPAEGCIWRYEPSTGVWRQQADEVLNNLLADIGQHCPLLPDTDLSPYLNARVCRDLRAFMPPLNPNPFENRPERIVHVANGMLEIGDDGNLTLQPFSPEYYSRNRCEITYDPEVQCTRFLTELLGAALPQDDIDMLQRYCGQCLLGENVTQTFLVLTGTAGGGKGTIVNVIRKVIGGDNVVELRTSQLGSRFEYGQFIGKTLLIGSDVRSDFLLQRGASHIKSLCGGDPLTAEIKGVTGGVSLKGEFNILITANDRLQLNIDGDIDAWRRRVLWIPFERPRTERPIPDFADILVCEEGSGILNWMIEGAVKVLNGRIPVHSLAVQRLDQLLRESDSIYGFLTDRVEPDPDGEAHAGLTCDALQLAYERWCSRNGYIALPVREAARKMKETIGRLFRIGQSHDLLQLGQYVRGYHGLRFRNPDRPVQPEKGEDGDTPALPAPPHAPVQRDGLDEDDLGIVQPAFGF